MVYTVTLNPSLDYVVEVDDFATGGINRTKNEMIFPGGKGINVSTMLRNLGVENTALGFRAGFTGEELSRVLKERGIRDELIEVKGLTRINMKLKSREETEINAQGPVIREADAQKLYEKLGAIGEGDYLILAGNIPGSMPASSYEKIMERVSDHRVSTVVDATGEALKRVLHLHPFLIKPNHHELGELFDREIRTEDEILNCAKKLQELGARNVLVSRAKDGACLLTEDGDFYTSPAPSGEVVNSVGAGDSMVAGFVAGYLKSKDYEEALKLGLCAGSASAFQKDIAGGEDVYELRRKLGK